MPDLVSRFKYELKSVPGAVVTFKRPTAASRAAFLVAQSATLAKVREIQRERKPLDDAYREAMRSHDAELLKRVDSIVESETITRVEAEARVDIERVQFYIQFRSDHPDWADLVDQQAAVEHDGIGWARLRQMVAAVENLSVEGETVQTADDLIEKCPPEVTDELIAEAERISGLGATERGELPLRGTSPLPVGGTNPSTTAPSVENFPAST